MYEFKSGGMMETSHAIVTRMWIENRENGKGKQRPKFNVLPM